MTSLPPHLERLHAQLMEAAAARTAQTTAPARRRRPRRLAAVVAVAALASTGAALAATSTNPLDWLRGGDPQRELRVAPDPSRHVEGDFARQIDCTPTSATAAACTRVPDTSVCTSRTTSSGGVVETCVGRPEAVTTGETGASAPPARRGSIAGGRYDLMTRVVTRPHMTVDVVERALAGRDTSELFVPDAPAGYRITVGQILAAAHRATPEFWERVDVLYSMQGGAISTSTGGSGTAGQRDLVPPEGVDRFLTCTDAGATLTCRPIAQGEMLPVGAPLYALQPDDTWRAVPQRAQTNGDYTALMGQVFGRDLTPVEQMLVFVPAAAALESSTVQESVTAPAPTGSEAVTATP